MHYKTPRINLAIQSLETFLDAVESLGWPVDRRTESTIELSRDRLPSKPTIICLEPCR